MPGRDCGSSIRPGTRIRSTTLKGMIKPCRKCGQMLPLNQNSRLCPACQNEYNTQNRRNRQTLDPIRYWGDNTRRQAKQRALSRGIPFTITSTDLERKVALQEERCWYCDGEMRFRASGRQVEDSPSVDQVDPGGGYTPENTVICCWRCNRQKSDATLEELEQLVEGVRRWKDEQGRAGAGPTGRDRSLRRGGHRGPHLDGGGREPPDGSSG